jgi:hypothetical protein
MRVYFERSGGFAGINMHIELDTDSLSDDETQTLREHVNEADFGNLPTESTRPTRGADRFQYVVRVETDEGKVHTVTAIDGAIPPALQPLLGYLQKQMKKRRR